MGTLLWFIHQHDLMEHAQEFESDVDSALRSMTLHLQHNQEHLALLAAKFAPGALKAQAFQDEVFAFVRDNPELENVILTDADLIVLRVVPDANTGRSLGRRWSPGKSFRAYLHAQATHQPAHTGLFEIHQRQAGFAVYVPIWRDGEFLGTIGGIYTCEKFLRHTVPRHVLENNRVSLISERDPLSCSLGDVAHIDDDFVRDVEFTLSDQGIWLRLQRYEGDLFEIEVWLLIALCVMLTLGMAYGMVVLARYAAERQQAQQVLRRERDNLVNVFEAMADGVAIVSTQLDLQYVNPVLVQDFGPYEHRKCYAYFHGHSEPCATCMMDDIIAGKMVHTEWCYPRNERTYDLIDTQVNNPDGSISKLKIFRDMTERAEAEAALEESEQRFHQLFERAADALFLYDVEGRIVDVNQTACDTLGYSRDEFQALTMADICLECSSGPLQNLLHARSPATPRIPATLLARPCPATSRSGRPRSRRSNSGSRPNELQQSRRACVWRKVRVSIG
jgi:PAS domain-containing protein